MNMSFENVISHDKIKSEYVCFWTLLKSDWKVF